MSNKYRWHVVVIPEDDATRQLGNGLANAFSEMGRRIKFLPVSRGWKRAVECVKSLDLNSNSFRRVLLIIDFDKNKDRLESIKAKEDFSEFRDRIFILGCFKEAEDLKELLSERNLEEVGKILASNCNYWDSPLLLTCRSDACRLKAELNKEAFQEN